MSYSGAGFKGGTRQIRAGGVRDILRLGSSWGVAGYARL